MSRSLARLRWGVLLCALVPATAPLVTAIADAAPAVPLPATLGRLTRGPGEVELAEREAEFDAARGARAVLPLLGLGPLDDLLLDRGESLLAFLRRAVERTTAPDPLVAAQARLELARRLDRRGRHEEATKVRAPLALLDSGALVAGPFASETGASLAADAVLPPEASLLRGAISPAVTWPAGAAGATARLWPLPRMMAGGVVALGAMLRPDNKIAAYVIYAVRCERALDAVLRLGSTGAHVVWLNGRRLGAGKGDRPLTLDADGYAAPLQPGLNRLVVRVSVGDRPPELLVRLTDRRGASLRGWQVVDAASEAARAPVVVAASASAGPPPPTLRRLLEAQAADVRSGLDRDSYLILAGVEGPRPEAACARASTFAAAPPSRRHLELLLACREDEDARRRALEARLAVLTLDSAAGQAERISLLTRLGELGLRGRTQHLGEERLVAAVAGSEPAQSWPARERLAQLDADRGLSALARGNLEALFRIAPARRVSEALAQLAQRSGRHEEALAMYRRLAEELPGDMGLVRQLASLERGRGRRDDLEAALERLRGVRDVRDRETAGLERADLEEGLGRVERAVAELAALLELAPEEPRLEERLGRLLLAAGRRDDALTHLRRALALKPQSPELRALLAEIDSQSGGGELARRFGVDVAALRTRASQSALGRGDPARVLYDGRTVRVHPNGLEETFVERLVEIGDRRGAEQEGAVSVRYAPDSEVVEVRVARVYKASGETVEAASIDERELSEPWAGLFYDMRAQVIRLPALQPGDVLHVAYTVSDHGRRNELSDSFGDLHMLQEGMARLETVYRLLAPRTRTMHFNRPHLLGRELAPVISDEGDERRYQLVVRDVPKYRAEIGMPGEAEIGAHVHVSTFADWSEVARFYRGLAAPQLEPDAEIRRAAQAAVKGHPRLEDKVAAIYDLVVSSTRYVGLEFGVHGYQPYKVAQVWARRFGDCKDKASLLVVMLKEVGVDATLVLLRTRREGGIDAEPASFAPFDHAIAYVPALRRYLDGTAELSGSTELPAEDQGVAVLHVDDGVLRRSPIAGPEGARSEVSFEVQLAPDGSALVEESHRVAGQAAETWRRQLQSPAQRIERFEQSWAQRSPGAKVRRVDLPHLADRERPVEAVATVELPRLARADAAGLLSVAVLLRDAHHLSSFARLSTREHALELPYASIERERVRFRLPRGARAHLPAGAELSGPFGRFSLRFDTRTDEGVETVEVAAETVLGVRRVSAAEYPAFRAFLAQIDRAVAGQLHVELSP